jgi:hypothetical protein
MPQASTSAVVSTQSVSSPTSTAITPAGHFTSTSIFSASTVIFPTQYPSSSTTTNHLATSEATQVIRTTQQKKRGSKHQQPRRKRAGLQVTPGNDNLTYPS